MKSGRNDPCPCGSGRKYKKCCLNREGLPAEAPSLAPADLVRARVRAFDAGDFGFIYDTYHPDSYFRRQFPDRAAYLLHGRSLSGDFSIREFRILKECVEGDEARLIFYLDTLYRGERSESFELSLFLMTPQGWRYHSGQKLSREEFSGEIEAIDWEDFEKVKDKVFF